jgi:hypothetical protein
MTATTPPISAEEILAAAAAIVVGVFVLRRRALCGLIGHRVGPATSTVVDAETQVQVRASRCVRCGRTFLGSDAA